MPRKTATSPRLSRSRGQVLCHDCDITQLLAKTGEGCVSLPEAKTAVCSRGPYMPGDRIYRRGSPFSTLYAVSSGSVKTERISASGHLQVTGFYLQGDMFGIETLGEPLHLHDAIALEKTWVCELDVATFMKLCRKHESMLQSLFQLLAKREQQVQHHRISHQGYSNAERVTCFLKDFAEQSRLCMNHTESRTRLPMTKEDIASYLAITPESLSRILKRLEKAGVLENQAHAFTLLPAADQFSNASSL